MDPNVKSYLLSRGYASHVVERGIRGLLSDWEAVGVGLRQGSHAYVNRDEFLNDMDGRRILRECIQVLGTEKAGEILSRLQKADEEFKAQTIETRHCIWGDSNAVKNDFSREIDWYYYRRPKSVDESWHSFCEEESV